MRFKGHIRSLGSFFRASLNLISYFGIFLTCCIAAPSANELLTDTSARAEVSSEAISKEARYQAKLSILLEEEIVNSHVVFQGEDQLIINAVKPVSLEPLRKTNKTEVSNSPEKALTAEEFAVKLAAMDKRFEYISVRTTVFGDSHSLVMWRDRDTGNDYEVWTNVSLLYLRFADSFKSEGIRYDYFGLPTQVYTREKEATRIRLAKKHGYKKLSTLRTRWKEPPVDFREGLLEYYVVAKQHTEVPEKLYRQLDALFGYYLKNQQSLKVRHLNAKKIAEARAQYRAIPCRQSTRAAD